MDSVKHLNYAPKPPAAEVYLRRAYRFTLVAGLGAVLFFWGPGTLRWATVLYWQHRCMTYEPAENHRVYECDLTNGREIFSETNRVEAAYEEMFSPGVRLRWTMPAIFLHEMRQPNGESRLVRIDVPRFAEPKSAHAEVYNLEAEILTPGWMEREKSSGLLDLPIEIPGDARRIRFFEGFIDPHNPSHLTFGFEIDGILQTCDCWLNDSGQLIAARRH